MPIIVRGTAEAGILATTPAPETAESRVSLYCLRLVIKQIICCLKISLQAGVDENDPGESRWISVANSRKSSMEMRLDSIVRSQKKITSERARLDIRQNALNEELLSVSAILFI